MGDINNDKRLVYKINSFTWCTKLGSGVFAEKMDNNIHVGPLPRLGPVQQEILDLPLQIIYTKILFHSLFYRRSLFSNSLTFI